MQTETSSAVRFFLEKGGHIRVVVLGKPTDYSLRGLEGPHSMTIPRVKESVTLACLRLSEYADKIYVPKLNMCNAEFGHLDKHTFHIESSGVRLIKGRDPIDSFDLNVDSSVLMRTADCVTLLLWHESSDTVVVGHCSRDSLISREEVQGRIRTRSHSSVINGMMERFRHISRTGIHALLICGINGRNFVHNTKDRAHGVYNHRMFQFLHKNCWDNGNMLGGCLSLHGVIQDQLREYGVPAENIKVDDSDTFSNPDLWSHKKGDMGRNGILITYR
ncbi:MAG: laccase domain-containing protein [Candidatus Pacebacteria bacterium]|nr:laccase domain-containing protein [Candidatus Paceibacterota bacterium]